MVQLLLLQGAHKDALNKAECSPLYLAAQFGYVATVLALLAAGADVDLRCGELKKSVLHVAAGHGHTDFMRAAVERGAEVDAADARQWTPLHYAANKDNAEVIDLLVEAGANVEARAGQSRTPLHFAVGDPSLEAVLTLLKHGADVNARDNDRFTPLHWAAERAGVQGVAKVVDSLLRSGADETVFNFQGEAAANVVGLMAFQEEEDQLAQDDVDRVRELLNNAPAHRAWRRRGYLVLCRAHPDIMQHVQDTSSAHAGVGRTTRGGARVGRTAASCSSETVEASPVDGQDDGDSAFVVAMVLGLREEGIFRTIVGYL